TEVGPGDAAGGADARGERRPVAVRAALAVARRAHVDQVGIDLAQAFRAEAVPLGRARPEPVQDDVSPLGALADDVRAFLGCDIDADAVLALHDLGPAQLREG